MVTFPLFWKGLSVGPGLASAGVELQSCRWEDGATGSGGLCVGLFSPLSPEGPGPGRVCGVRGGAVVAGSRVIASYINGVGALVMAQPP